MLGWTVFAQFDSRLLSEDISNINLEGRKQTQYEFMYLERQLAVQ